MKPWLRAAGARIDADGSVLTESVSFEAGGARVGLVGDWEPLFRLWSRQATLTRGTLEVLGMPPTSAVPSNTVGVAPARAALPAEGTATEYLTTSARLLGVGRRAAAGLVARTLETLGVSALGKKKLAELNPTEERALGIVHAVLGAPPVIALDRPLAGLEDEAATAVATLIDRATEGRRLIVSALSPSALGPEMTLLSRADHILVLAAGEVVASGPPAEVLLPTPRYVVRATRAVTELESALGDRGLRVERVIASGDLPGAGCLVVHLPEGGGTSPIVDAALAVDAPIVEMMPVGVAPAPRP